MRVARVVGNVVSTIKDSYFDGHKLMIIEYLDENGEPDGSRVIAFDACHSGIGDTVLAIADGGAAISILGDMTGKKIVADIVIAGVVDYATFDGRVFAGNTPPPAITEE
ncbi:MAG: EutN/CcmL family microcompartment protein [Oscillospiraceae bacterium]|nr:EutN/CcmL family microcompartment protein [Oscillospiraceae bacterium]